MELVRHGSNGLGEHLEAVHAHGGLPGAGDEGFAGDADPVAALQQLPEGPAFLRAALLGEHALNGPAHIAHVEELGAPHVAQRIDAPDEFHLLTLGKVGLELGRGRVGVEAATVGIHPQGADLLHLLAAYGNQFLLRGTRCVIGRCFRHSAAIIRAFRRKSSLNFKKRD